MPAPWEKYGAEATPQSEEAGPWLKYRVPAPESGIPQEDTGRSAQDIYDIGSAAGKFAKTSALPTAGSIAVPAAATALMGPANTPFIPLEQGFGSGLGEVANQLLGITEPSLKQIGIATVAPMAIGYGMNALRTLKSLPGALNTAAPQMATNQIRSYRSAIHAKDLFDQATAQGIKIPLNKTTSALQEVENIMMDVTPAGRQAFEKVLNDTGLRDLATAPGGISPSKMQNLLREVGKLESKASREGGLEGFYLGKFFGSLKDDLENSGTQLLGARNAFKREAVLDDIEQAISNAMFIKKGQGLQTEFSPNKILNTLNKTDEGLGQFFSQSFSRSEQAEIKNLFGFLNTIPSLQPGAGQQFGSGRFWQRASHAGAGSGIGAGIGYAAGGPMGAAIGAGVGILAPEAANFGKLVLQAWKMPGGKQVVKTLLSNSDSAKLPYIAESLTSFIVGGLAKERAPVISGTMLQPFENMK